MREVNLPAGRYPYIQYHVKKAIRRKPTPPQQTILDKMREGVWYESEFNNNKEDSSLQALVYKGFCDLGRIARKDNDGNLVDLVVLSPDELILDALMGRLKEQPIQIYRIAKTSPVW